MGFLLVQEGVRITFALFRLLRSLVCVVCTLLASSFLVSTLITLVLYFLAQVTDFYSLGDPFSES